MIARCARFFFVLTTGCFAGGPGYGGGTGTTTGTTTTTTTTSESDDGADANPPCSQACDLAADCCVGSVYPEDFSCPGDFPNNWTCVAGECVNECTADADCLIPNWKCLPIGGVNTCFFPCGDTEDCNDALMPGTQCIGTVDNSSLKYCVPSDP